MCTGRSGALKPGSNAAAEAVSGEGGGKGWSTGETNRGFATSSDSFIPLEATYVRVVVALLLRVHSDKELASDDGLRRDVQDCLDLRLALEAERTLREEVEALAAEAARVGTHLHRKAPAGGPGYWSKGGWQRTQRDWAEVTLRPGFMGREEEMHLHRAHAAGVYGLRRRIRLPPHRHLLPSPPLASPSPPPGWRPRLPAAAGGGAGPGARGCPLAAGRAAGPRGGRQRGGQQGGGGAGGSKVRGQSGTWHPPMGH